MRATILAGVGLVLVLATAACGQAAGPTGTASAVDGKAQELASSLAAKTGRKTSRFTYDFSAAGQHLTGKGEGRYSGSDSAISTTTTVAGEPAEVRVVDKAGYVKLPKAARARVGGKTWVKVTADSKTDKVISAYLDAAELSDPSLLITQIQKSGKVVETEQVTLDGKQVTHYRVDIDAAEAADEYGLTGLDGKVTNVSVELWIDGDGLPARITETFSGATSESITVDYRDWGAEVSIQAPPAGQVGEL
ncbi:MAG TPA: hypothetical protein VG674_17115 [Amycolatopsis sp.]|nr:hypothetical protein [Amycolatopsis sp.]